MYETKLTAALARIATAENYTKYLEAEVKHLRVVLKETLAGYLATEYYEQDIVGRAKFALNEQTR